MKLKKAKKGFTLVELVVVIAIIAVLSTVSVVGYFGFTKKANISGDKALVSQLNTILKADQATNGKAETPTEMLKVMEDGGFKVENLTPTTSKYSIVWNQEGNQFVLLDESGKEVYGSLSSKKYMNWNFVDYYKDTNGFSSYLKGNASISSLEIKTGIDVGNNTVGTITYSGKDSISNIVIRTNSFDTTVNVTAYESGDYGSANYACDTIMHYGYAKEVVVNKAGFSSYHEYGKVGFITLNEGKLVAENESSVVTTYIPDTNKLFDIVVNDGGTLKDVYAKMPTDAETANTKITDAKVEVKSLTTDTTVTEDTITSIVEDKKNESKNEILDSEVGNGEIKVDGSYRVGTVGYDTFEEALAAAKSNKSTLALQTQMIYENESALVNEGETLTLDLNGYTWKPSTKWYTIQNKGTLTIKDCSSDNSGNVTSWTSGKTGSSLIDNWGTLTIENGNYYSTGSTVVKNEPNATLVINGGKFELNNTETGCNAILNYAKATINNGKVISHGGAAVYTTIGDINNIDNCILTINGGEFIATNKYSDSTALKNKSGFANVTNGSFISEQKYAIYVSNDYNYYDENGIISGNGTKKSFIPTLNLFGNTKIKSGGSGIYFSGNSKAYINNVTIESSTLVDKITILSAFSLNLSNMELNFDDSISGTNSYSKLVNSLLLSNDFMNGNQIAILDFDKKIMSVKNINDVKSLDGLTAKIEDKIYFFGSGSADKALLATPTSSSKENCKTITLYTDSTIKKSITNNQYLKVKFENSSSWNSAISNSGYEVVTTVEGEYTYYQSVITENSAFCEIIKANGEKVLYASIYIATTHLEDGDTIRLLKDVSTSNLSISVSNVNVILDLNGMNIKNITITGKAKNTKLTINDSVGGAKILGRVSAVNSDTCTIKNNIVTE